MKEIKKGYRLTAEEEKIVRGQAPEPCGGKPRGGGALLPLLGLFALMIALAWGFLYLVGGGKGTPPTERSPTEITAEQRAVFTEKLHLTAEESAAFWPLYTRLCAELDDARRRSSDGPAPPLPEDSESLPPGASADPRAAAGRPLERTVFRYSEAFAALLGEERAAAVFRLYEEWKGVKLVPNR